MNVARTRRSTQELAEQSLPAGRIVLSGPDTPALEELAHRLDDAGYVCGIVVGANSLVRLLEDARPDLHIRRVHRIGDREIGLMARAAEHAIRSVLLVEQPPLSRDHLPGGSKLVTILPWTVPTSAVVDTARGSLSGLQELDAAPHTLVARSELAASLTIREMEVAAALLRGYRVGQIAGAMSISEYTVRNHLRSIFRKLDVHSQAELIERFQGEFNG